MLDLRTQGGDTVTAEPVVLFDHEPEPVKAKPATHRGTSNGNSRGGSEDRRRRRAWLVVTYRADIDVAVVVDPDGEVRVFDWTDDEAIATFFGGHAERRPACRCYRCGVLLADLADVDPTNKHPRRVTVDRIIPGCQGGTYKRTNIRPACALCNERTGQALSVERRR